MLRSGTFPDGHVVPITAMPWASFSNWTEEDRHAVVVYLRHLKPIRAQTPEPVPGNALTIPGAFDQDYGRRITESARYREVNRAAALVTARQADKLPPAGASTLEAERQAITSTMGVGPAN